MTIQDLRQKHSRFIYQSFEYELIQNNLEIKFHFLIEPDIKFTPTLSIKNLDQMNFEMLDKVTLEKLIFNLGMVETISYWKTACSPELIVEAGFLNKQQIAWWHDLFINGLGEFFYTNQIDFTEDHFLKISCQVKEKQSAQEKSPKNPSSQIKSKPSYLVPVGGGKDSALMLGILEKNSLKFSCLLLEPLSPAAEKACQISNAENIIKVFRQIDPKLLELNNQGYLNGHTPFSAYLAFLSTLVAWIFNYEQILVANERSANQGNIEFHGKEVNHQYSKTYDFEKRFRAYIDQYLQPGKPQEIQSIPEYLSFLRPFYELQIAKSFANYPQFFSLFKSCNVSQQQELWCHLCPKCLFVFMMLFPFIETEILTSKIFKSNLFEDETLLKTARELIGSGDCKPFECVGTHQESLVALHLAVKKYQQSSLELPIVLKILYDEFLSKEKDLELQAEKLLSSWNEENFLSPDLETILKQELKL